MPQLFWASDYDRELAELLAPADCAPLAGRRFCSLLLARCSPRSAGQAAVRYLDLPERFIHGGYNTTFAKLRRDGRFDELARRIKQIANQHATRGLIDHKQRRAHLAAWTGIDAADLAADPTRTATAKPPLGPAEAARPRIGLVLVPAHKRPRARRTDRAPPPGLRHHYAFVRSVIPALRDRLLLLGDILLTTPPGALETVPARFAVALHRRRTPRPRTAT